MQIHLLCDRQVNLKLSSLLNIEGGKLIEFCDSWEAIELYAYTFLKKEGLLEYFMGTYPKEHTSPQGASRGLLILLYE